MSAKLRKLKIPKKKALASNEVAFIHPSLVSSSAIGSAVPGGVVVWDIPDGATGIRYQNRPVLIIGSKAIVGIPVFEKPGQHSLSFMLDGERKNHNFEVKEKSIPNSTLRLRTKRWSVHLRHSLIEFERNPKDKEPSMIVIQV